MRAKRIYFYNDKARAVAEINDRRFAVMLESCGFVECDNETYLCKRWLTWNKVGRVEVEGERHGKKKSTRRNS